MGGHFGSAGGIRINSLIDSCKIGTTGFLPSLPNIALKGISKYIHFLQLTHYKYSHYLPPPLHLWIKHSHEC